MKNIFGLTLGALLVAQTAAAQVAGMDGHDDYMVNGGQGHHGMGHMGTTHGFWLCILAAVVVVVLLVVFLMRRNKTVSTPTALDILDARFARGEIDAAEFDERRKVLL